MLQALPLAELNGRGWSGSSCTASKVGNLLLHLIEGPERLLALVCGRCNDVLNNAFWLWLVAPSCEVELTARFQLSGFSVFLVPRSAFKKGPTWLFAPIQPQGVHPDAS